MFVSSLLAPVWKNWRKEANEDFQFYEGDQWTAIEKAALEERGQPLVTENLIMAKVARHLGQFQRQHSTVGVVGRNAPVDEASAATVSDVFRWVDQINGYEFEESDQIKDGLIGGFGVMEITSGKDASGNPDIIARQENPFYLFVDPYSRRYDWNEDAKFICRSKWLDLSDACDLWPDKEKELKNCVSYGYGRGMSGVMMDPTVLLQTQWNYFDITRQRLRPVEVYYKRKVTKRIVISPTGVRVELDYLGARQAQAQAAPGSQIDTVTMDEMWLGIYCGNTLIHHDRFKDQDGMFPFIPYYADRKKSGEPFGPVRNLKSLQRERNKRRSKALHLMSNNQAIVEQNAVEDWAEFALEKARPDGIMKVRKRDGVELIKNQDMAQSQMAMHNETSTSMDLVSGQGPDSMGQASEVRSGVGIARKQMATDLITMPLATNIRRTRRIKLEKIWGLVCQHFTQDLVFQITDDPQAAKTVSLPQDRLAALRDLQFNFVISDVADSLTLQSEQFEIIANVLPQILPLGPGPAQFLMEMSDIKPKQKQGLMQMLAQMNQKPPDDPKISLTLNWSDLTPQEKAVFAAKKLGMPELAAYELQEGEPSLKRTTFDAGMAKQTSVERMNDKRQEVELITHGSQVKADMIQGLLDHKADMTKAETTPSEGN